MHTMIAQSPPFHVHVIKHEHLIIDAELIQKIDYSQKERIISQLIERLLHELDMKELAPLEIYNATDTDLPGWSFIQAITTSHISGHYFEESDKLSHIHLDIYSCKNYEWRSVLPILNDALKLSQWSANLLIRSIVMTKQKHTCISGKGGEILMVQESEYLK